MKIKTSTKRWPLAIGVTVCIIANTYVPAFALQATQTGKASWYALTSMTASGEMANPAKMTAAHRTLAFGTRILVTNLANNRSIILCVNDRGPFVDNRIVDVTKAAAHKLGFLNAGLANVRVDAMEIKSGGCS